jgi:CDP-diacylglycerol--serine O-phosphatidyltransferase
MKRVALLPNIFTTGNMVCGISAILYAFGSIFTHDTELFQRACWLVMLAILLDGLDGRIAAWTRSSSEFGVQYDSMADLISFGVAPAFLLTSHLQFSAEPGAMVSPICWALMWIQIVCVALRLARFNLQNFKDEKHSFEGLPSPMAAALICLLLLSIYKYDLTVPAVGLLMAVVAVGGLMVSSIPFPSLKKSDFFKTQPLPSFFLVVLVFGLFLVEPEGPMLLGASGYILYGLGRQVAPRALVERFERRMWSEDSEEESVTQ